LTFRLFVSYEHALVAALGSLRIASAAVYGGGVRNVQGVVNLSVPHDFHSDDLEGFARARLEEARLPQECAVMLTAAKVENAVLSRVDGVACAITAGLSNPASIGISPPFEGVGTINIILVVDAVLDDACLIGAVQSAAEAKCAAVRDMDVSVDGDRATGTTTDCITVCATMRGDAHEYAGSATRLGYRIGRLVRQGVRRAVELQDGPAPTSRSS